MAVACGRGILGSNDNLPSGYGRQDYFHYVLIGMYQKLVLEKLCKEAVSGEDREKIMATPRKPDWTFAGMMTFVAFGPLAIDESHKSNQMMHGTFIFMCWFHIGNPFTYIYCIFFRGLYQTSKPCKMSSGRKRSEAWCGKTRSTCSCTSN